jgi:CubicO group peptidase (beta-lactamase class C family)
MPSFRSGAAGLVSTATDMLAFGQMLLALGQGPDGSSLISRPSVEAMTTNQIGPQHGPGPGTPGTLGWGLGVAVQTARPGPVRSVGSYGWHGSLGTSWWNDPKERLVGVLMTTDAPRSGIHLATSDFWTCLYAALGD